MDLTMISVRGCDWLLVGAGLVQGCYWLVVEAWLLVDVGGRMVSVVYIIYIQVSFEC